MKRTELKEVLATVKAQLNEQLEQLRKTPERRFGLTKYQILDMRAAHISAISFVVDALIQVGALTIEEDAAND